MNPDPYDYLNALDFSGLAKLYNELPEGILRTKVAARITAFQQMEAWKTTPPPAAPAQSSQESHSKEGRGRANT